MKQTLSVYNLYRQEISVNTIKYVEGYNNYSILHIVNQKPIVLSRSLFRFEEELPTFVRIHKRYLVNPQFVEACQLPSPKQLTVLLTSGEALAVSRRRISQVLAVLTQSQ